MPREPLNSLDDYDRYLTARLNGWSPAQRTAFAAAMADRWMGVYQKFSQREEWGGPDSLRRSVCRP